MMNSFLPFEQALGPGGAITEGAAGAGDVVDPGLERGGNREIVHRHGKDDDVRGLDLFDEGVGQRGGLPLGGAARGSRCHRGRERGQAQMRHAVRRQLTLHHGGAGMGLAPAIDELAGDQAGLRAIAEQAGGNEEQIGHCRSFHIWRRGLPPSP